MININVQLIVWPLGGSGRTDQHNIHILALFAQLLHNVRHKDDPSLPRLVYSH